MIGSCLMISVIPIAASIPLMTAVGTYFAILLVFARPRSTWIAPAMITARRNSDNHNFPILVTTIATSPAAGPDTLRGELLKNHTTIPPIIPAISPLISGVPLATAIPKQSGNATRNTTSPEGRSCFTESFIAKLYQR